jgi:bifunctional oligoribonuclease and PAP phosphatase NrnA
MDHRDVTAPVELIGLLDSWQRFVCVGHVTPDADCLAAMFAVARAWSGSRCEVCVSLPEESLSQKLAFMADWAGVRRATVVDLQQADGFCVVDTAKKSRCNLIPGTAEGWPGGRKVINVDHHASNTRFGDVNWVVGDAASSSELIYQLIRQAGRPIDGPSASLLYAGILTDTAGFTLPSTSAFCLRAAADLVSLGADVAELGERVYRSHRAGEFRLLRTIYANTHLVAADRIAYSTASYQEIADAGCTAADIDDQVSVPRSLQGIRIAILFTEGNQGKTRLNFRGEQGFGVLELARQFHGGGHDFAAGAILDCPLEEAVQRVLPVAIQAVNGG